MSLDDRLNQHDGSLISRVDELMIRIHEKIAEKYQKITGKDRDSLERFVYGASMAICAGYVGITGRYLALIGIATPLSSYVYYKTIRGNILEEAGAQMIHLPRNTFKYLRMAFYVFSGVTLGLFAYELGAGIYNKEENLVEQGFTRAMGSTASFLLATGLYISKSNPEPPPPPKEKSLRDKLMDKIRSYFPGEEPVREPNK